MGLLHYKITFPYKHVRTQFVDLLRLSVFPFSLYRIALCHPTKRSDFTDFLIIWCFLVRINFTDYGVLIGSLSCTRNTQTTHSSCLRNDRQPVGPPDGAHGVAIPQGRCPESAPRIIFFTSASSRFQLWVMGAAKFRAGWDTSNARCPILNTNRSKRNWRRPVST